MKFICEIRGIEIKEDDLSILLTKHDHSEQLSKQSFAAQAILSLAKVASSQHKSIGKLLTIK